MERIQLRTHSTHYGRSTALLTEINNITSPFSFRRNYISVTFKNPKSILLLSSHGRKILLEEKKKDQRTPKQKDTILSKTARSEGDKEPSSGYSLEIGASVRVPAEYPIAAQSLVLRQDGDRPLFETDNGIKLLIAVRATQLSRCFVWKPPSEIRSRRGKKTGRERERAKRDEEWNTIISSSLSGKSSGILAGLSNPVLVVLGSVYLFRLPRHLNLNVIFYGHFSHRKDWLKSSVLADLPFHCVFCRFCLVRALWKKHTRRYLMENGFLSPIRRIFFNEYSSSRSPDTDNWIVILYYCSLNQY